MATLIVHGGAGRRNPGIRRETFDAGLDRALVAGLSALDDGALAAAVAAVEALEEDPVFNAGIGAVLTSAGTVELDAGVMEAEGLRVGAVAMVTDCAHPVRIARALLDDGRHVLLAGAGASRFAAERGLPLIDPEELRRAARPGTASPAGTVGAVCRDRQGRLAVAVSTGGTAGKLPGRVGDSAVCGAGFYADSPGAACATGHGEAFVRLAGCRRAVELMAAGIEAQPAAERVIAELGSRAGGQGGLIVVDAAGRPGVAHNSPHMTWAWHSGTASARW